MRPRIAIVLWNLNTVWRRRVGIEPDRRMLTHTSNGFEDRASHQTRCASIMCGQLFITPAVIGQPRDLVYSSAKAVTKFNWRIPEP